MRKAGDPTTDAHTTKLSGNSGLVPPLVLTPSSDSTVARKTSMIVIGTKLSEIADVAGIDT